MRKIIVTGNVGRDPEQRVAQPSGETFVTFSLATTAGTKANPRTDWYDVSCTGKLGETIMTYVRKGSKLLIEGTPTVSAYLNKEGKPVGTLRIFASTIEFIGSREHSENVGDSITNDDGQHVPSSTIGDAGFNAPGPIIQSDEVPF